MIQPTEVSTLIATLKQSLESPWADDAQREKIQLLESLYPIRNGEEDKPGYVPIEWITSLGLNPTDLPTTPAGLTWAELEKLAKRDSLWSDLYQWHKDRGETWRRWFFTVNYFATGEGHTMIFTTAGGYSKAEALAAAVREEGYWWGIGFDVHDTIPDNPVTNMLLTPALRKDLDTAGARSETIRLFRHVNYS